MDVNKHNSELYKNFFIGIFLFTTVLFFSQLIYASIDTYEFTIDSGKWMGTHWYHRLTLFIPSPLKINNKLFLFVTGSGRGVENRLFLKKFTEDIGIPTAILFDIPNQPLFGGLKEDALISYSLKKFIETDNKNWIIFTPMIWAIRNSMNFLEKYLLHNKIANIDGFILCGISKRGWVSYLAATKDKRVKGIVPGSFDTVNFKKTIPHQIDMWGKYSFDLNDYSKNGLLDIMFSSYGEKILSVIDPWYLKKKLKIPKLIIVGTNDSYWTIDAANFYFHDLWGQNYLFYLPNRGHSLSYDQSLLNIMEKFTLSVAHKYKLPSFSIKTSYDRKKDLLQVNIKSKKIKPIYANIWYASSYNKDFRNAVFRKRPLEFLKNEKIFRGFIQVSESKFIAWYPEMKYKDKKRIYSLCAPVQIINGDIAHPEMVPQTGH